MDDWAETDLAWELAEIACLLMPERDRIEVYTAIGAGYSYTAIGTLLRTIDRADVAISPALEARLDEWLSAYVHHCDAPRLQKILDSIRSTG
ncbi:hypothetical protein [Mycobacterium sp.]|uniref:hypothetical protein n=1 Tax=Mycobacterium sp. TaxID=1785 RepID=UPI002BB4D1BD|nr:hypothetical protein [Mycobacterium sp.]HTQ22898.1 hypothetical protein [Mycobacterium sp.]